MKWREKWIDAGTECRWIKEDAEVILKKEKMKRKKERRRRCRGWGWGEETERVNWRMKFLISYHLAPNNVLYLYMNISLNCLHYSLIYRNYTLHRIDFTFRGKFLHLGAL